MEKPRVALIHALEESVLPSRSAMARNWPEATGCDLLDTSLAVDLARAGSVNQSIMSRFKALTDYAVSSGSIDDPLRGILFTCSAFGKAIDAVKETATVPVLRPNESAFKEACRLGKRIGLVVTFKPSLKGLTEELEYIAACQGKAIHIVGVFVDGALNALKAGNEEEHDRLVAEAASGLGSLDVLVLGQFSLARASSRVKEAVLCPVITTPDAAISELKRLVV